MKTIEIALKKHKISETQNIELGQDENKYIAAAKITAVTARIDSTKYIDFKEPSFLFEF